MTQSDKIASETFASAMGQAVWLMSMSPDHRDLPIRDIETRVSIPLLLGQFRVYTKGKQPVAFLTWAAVTDEVKARLDAGERPADIRDWKAGSNMVVVDCVSPFNDGAVFVKAFLDSAEHHS
ncbi:MAG: toxin-activating lysine-acyltransferase [Tropicimonas sp.]|uniref:toxin-activating lysine-acyltransferase n=1 Tax=Tropicimonas sp. TaxID=2067044 RepID=UPI003A842DF1